jgi:hypothetical protein
MKTLNAEVAGIAETLDLGVLGGLGVPTYL